MSVYDLFFGLVVFVFGLITGSFLNVCIYRMPREESIVKPDSHCPACEKPIAWYDNIPLVSYIVLRARCRHCGGAISPRYFAIELVCGLMWLGLWGSYGLTARFAGGAFLGSILLAETFTDFEAGIIPDKLNYSGMAAGLLLSAVFPELQGQRIWYAGLLASMLGLLTGGLLLFAMGWLGDVLFKKESMGGGDIKLMAMLGSFLGIQKVLFVFLLAPILALPFALYMKFFKKAETIAYGPYLALTGAWLYVAGDLMISRVLNLYGV